MELKGKAAVVTGASSDDGIGSECAKILASRGCNGVVNYATNKAGGEKIAEACRAAGADAIAVQGDVSKNGDCERLVSEQLIDYLRCAVTHAGGISHLRKIAALAELHEVRIGCHGPTDLSPITLAASTHFHLAVHNFGLHEYVPHSSETDEVFPHAYTIADGTLHPGEEPGHGATIDEHAAKRFPYEPAYLPVNRLDDGTLHSW